MCCEDSWIVFPIFWWLSNQCIADIYKFAIHLFYPENIAYIIIIKFLKPIFTVLVFPWCRTHLIHTENPVRAPIMDIPKPRTQSNLSRSEIWTADDPKRQCFLGGGGGGGNLFKSFLKKKVNLFFRWFWGENEKVQREFASWNEKIATFSSAAR